ncbi:MAG TPA: tetratricopeptide repeat protein [Roseiflexaceae bacterium]|nr:tetratricopeptide repeat protein [Roseiflexaceae bacterium]
MEFPEALRHRSPGTVPSRLRMFLLLLPEFPLLFLLISLLLLVGLFPIIGWCTMFLAATVLIRACLLGCGHVALGYGYLRVAIACGVLAARLFPWSSDALMLAGAALVRSGQPEHAERYICGAIRYAPERATLYAVLSGILLELGRASEALEAARRAVALDPACATAYLHLAESERLLGAATWVVEDRLRLGLRLVHDPTIEVVLSCALAALLIAQERLAEAGLATAHAEAALVNCPRAYREQLQSRLGELLIMQGRIDQARTYLT